MYTNNRDAYRQAFFIAWQKYQRQLSLDPVEAQLVEIILVHPEYHAMLNDPDTFQQQEFTVEENPFMHMSLHVAIREQVRANRPNGITQIHQQRVLQTDPHALEHQMMTCLAQMMWEAQQTGATPEEETYLTRLRQLP